MNIKEIMSENQFCSKHTGSADLSGAIGSLRQLNSKCNLFTSSPTHQTINHEVDDITFPLPLNGIVYEDAEALNIIKRFPKGSKHRGKVRKAMIDKGFVSSRTTFCRKVKKMEDKEFAEESIRVRGLQGVVTSRLGLGYKGEYIQPNIRDFAKWKGSIILPLIPVTFFAEAKYYRNSSYGIRGQNDQNIDICALLGNSDIVSPATGSQVMNESGSQNGHRYHYFTAQDPGKYPHSSNFATLCRANNIKPLKYDPTQLLKDDARSGCTYQRKQLRVSKLYFSNFKFPPPGSGKGIRTQHHIVLGHLRNLIENAAKIGHSPVVCTGQSNLNGLRFRCKQWNRRKYITKKKKNERRGYNMYSCTFTFALKWDKLGYYIPLLSSRGSSNGSQSWCNLGCAWHCCDEHCRTK